jgi:hypothetical protein
VSFEKLRISKPAATSSTIASAISAPAKRPRARRPPVLSLERVPPSRRLACGSDLAARKAGAKPKRKIANAEMASAKRSTT